MSYLVYSFPRSYADNIQTYATTDQTWQISAPAKPVNTTCQDGDYDSNGAIIYTSMVVVWYSLGIIGILITKFQADLALQSKQSARKRGAKPVGCYAWRKPKTDDSLKFEAAKQNRRRYTSHDKLHVLELLKNQAFRTKVWQTYYGNNKIPVDHEQRDKQTVDRIEEVISGIHYQLLGTEMCRYVLSSEQSRLPRTMVVKKSADSGLNHRCANALLRMKHMRSRRPIIWRGSRSIDHSDTTQMTHLLLRQSSECWAHHAAATTTTKANHIRGIATDDVVDDDYYEHLMMGSDNTQTDRRDIVQSTFPNLNPTNRPKLFDVFSSTLEHGI